jgi:hypothetical protein
LGGASPFEEGCDVGFIRCSWSNNVKETAEALSQLTDDEIRKRYEQNIDKMEIMLASLIHSKN